MATLIRAKQSLMGEYGKLKTGETGYCKASTAKYLVEKGMAEIVDENVEAPEKKIREHIFAKGYEPSKQESRPVLNNPIVKEDIPSFIDGGKIPGGPVLTGDPGPELSNELIEKLSKEGKDKTVTPEVKDEPEQAASKKDMTEEEKEREKKQVKETPKKQYK